MADSDIIVSLHLVILSNLWHSLPALLWLSSYVALHHLAVITQSGAKAHFSLHNFKYKL
jgi:hypothetical protein